MKSGRVKGGATIPAYIGTGRRFRSSIAQPVSNAAGSTRGIMGGAAQNIIEITSDDLVQNGGNYSLMGGPPIPMQIVTDRAQKGGPAQVVYPVDILGNYDPTFAGYIYKLRQIESDNLVGLWAQNELAGGVSIDYSGNDYHGAYTAVNLGQPGIPGLGMSSAGYDGAASFNNIYSAGFANDNLFANPGFEMAGGGGADIWANWTENAGDGALANEGVVVHEGADACKQTTGVGLTIYVSNDWVSVPNTTYRVRFWTRGDGANSGLYRVRDVTNAAYITDLVDTGITAAAYGMYEFTVTAPAGCVLMRLFLHGADVNGAVTYFDACEVRRTNGFLGDKGTIIAPAQVANAGVWTDGSMRYAVHIEVDASNRVLITKAAVNNRVDIYYLSGAATVSRFIVGLTTLDFMKIGITWDVSAGATGEVRYFLDGVQDGATDVGIGTWIGDLSNTSTAIGARNTTPIQVWSSNIGPVSVWNIALTPAQMLEASTA